MKAANLDPSAVDSVCVGNVLSCAGVDTPYVARHSLLRLGIGVDKPANTVNRLCGSGFQVFLNQGSSFVIRALTEAHLTENFSPSETKF